MRRVSARRFPDGFRWGTATSAHQVEGGNRGNDWWDFESLPGAIADGTQSGDACLHWERFDADFALAEADGQDTHRLSFEWSRIEPERGRIDAGAVAHYHEVLASLRRRRLRPLVTLLHFTLPRWVAAAGGWEDRGTIEGFLDFVRFCAREYGDEVDWWCTINEPEVYAFRAYSSGEWPPRRRDDSAALAVMANLLEAHGCAYRVLHEEDRADADGDGRAVVAGFAKHRPQLEPLRPWFPPDVARAWFENRVFNEAVVRAPRTGEIRLELPGARGVRRDVPALRGSLDYLGLNYYTRWKVRALGGDRHVARPGAPVTDLDWEIHPPGLGEVALQLSGIGVPLLVTENGFADAADAFRPRALVETLLHLARAIERGAPVIGYLHWSLMDNFEWSDGYRGRFGLYAVDFADPQRPRRRTRSAELFARIVRANAIPDDVLRDVGLDPAGR